MHHVSRVSATFVARVRCQKLLVRRTLSHLRTPAGGKTREPPTDGRHSLLSRDRCDRAIPEPMLRD